MEYHRRMISNHPSVWHPCPSKYEPALWPDRDTLCREGDSLRKELEGKRVLEEKNAS